MLLIDGTHTHTERVGNYNRPKRRHTKGSKPGTIKLMPSNLLFPS